VTDRPGRAAVVTGGGGGIGTAVALELARRGIAVVAMDPGAGLQGEALGEPTAEETARRIVAEGGVARASTASVTDRDAVRSLFAEVVAEYGSLDIVVNTAGILRFAPFLQASEDDWRAVLDVHLNGYLNVLAEALPVMAAAGYGRIVGVTSGAGLARAAADSAHYSCAKRAVAAVTWQLAGLLPEGVALNALSPLAATRMVTGGRTRDGDRDRGEERARDGDRNSGGERARGGGVDLSGMPPARDMAPIAAYLAGEEAGAFRGQVIFSAGPELSVISPPRLTEAVRTEATTDFAASLDTLVPVVLGPAEAQQRSTGGSNARFGAVFDRPQTAGPAPGASGARNCLVISDDQALTRALAPALARCGMTIVTLGAASLPAGFAAARDALGQAAQAAGGLDAVVVAPGRFAAPGPAPQTWPDLLAGYPATAGTVLAHASWLQAAAREAVRASRPLRVVHLTDATSPPLRAGAQAVAQLARCASCVQPELIEVFSIALETAERADLEPLAQLVARMLFAADASALRGAEMFARPGWLGIRSHPGPAATVSYGTPQVPSWVGDWLREASPIR
jgi:NAD(P)-dependent dehydrogenase (short-subunit alcohol dehydrogenase family)